ncbi:MAG: hypothetical protein V1721_07755 [Pseudomonadota bacterium]
MTQLFSRITFSLIAFVSSLNLFILLPVFLTVAALLAGYFRRYQWPADALRKSLTKALYQIRTARFTQETSPDHLKNELDGIFAQSPFKSLWTEYCASLHTVPARKGETGAGTVLATSPAEMFFSKESMIDAQINADFYRHLPGILAGIGIIGAFSGLMWGLHEFRPGSGESLPRLLQEVTSAFIGFGFAILASIFVTYREKSILSRCYRLVEMLNKEIDSLYATGAREEYLARLVRVSESNPPVTLEDLSRLLNDIADRQSALHERQNYVLSRQIAAAIKDTLSSSMEEITGAAKEITRSQEVLAKLAGDMAQSGTPDESPALRRKTG